MDNDESEKFEHPKKAGSSILGSLEKLVESSFSDLRPGTCFEKVNKLARLNWFAISLIQYFKKVNKLGRVTWFSISLIQYFEKSE